MYLSGHLPLHLCVPVQDAIGRLLVDAQVAMVTDITADAARTWTSHTGEGVALGSRFVPRRATTLPPVSALVSLSTLTTLWGFPAQIILVVVHLLLVKIIFI